jgi:hypothetical protein
MVTDAPLRPATTVTGCQRDSSSKRPWVSVVFVRRKQREESVDPDDAVDADQRLDDRAETRGPSGPLGS